MGYCYTRTLDRPQQASHREDRPLQQVARIEGRPPSSTQKAPARVDGLTSAAAWLGLACGHADCSGLAWHAETTRRLSRFGRGSEQIARARVADRRPAPEADQP
jgi:hypothetical protein